jgi:Domain of unknown function (DUF1707)
VSDLSGGNKIRASDQERNAVIEHLQAAYTEGRIDVTEYQERLDAAIHARTRGDLASLTVDLPAPTPDRRRKDIERASNRRQEWLDQWRDWLWVAIVLNGIWLVTSIAAGELKFYWPLLPLGIWAFINIAGMVEKDKNKGEDGDKDTPAG